MGLLQFSFAATEGIGVGLSAVAVIAYELILVGLSQLVAPHLNDVVTVSMSAGWVGSFSWFSDELTRDYED